VDQDHGVCFVVCLESVENEASILRVEEETKQEACMKEHSLLLRHEVVDYLQILGL
jgi:hypothetical protein